MSDDGKDLLQRGRLRNTSAQNAINTVAVRLAQKSAQPFPSNASGSQQQQQQGTARNRKPGTIKTVMKGMKRALVEVTVATKADAKTRAMDAGSDLERPPTPEDEDSAKDDKDARIAELETALRLKEHELAQMKTQPTQVMLAGDDSAGELEKSRQLVGDLKRELERLEEERAVAYIEGKDQAGDTGRLATALLAKEAEFQATKQELKDARDELADRNAIYAGNDQVVLGKYQDTMKKLNALRAELAKAKGEAKLQLDKTIADAQRDARAAKLALTKADEKAAKKEEELAKIQAELKHQADKFHKEYQLVYDGKNMKIAALETDKERLAREKAAAETRAQEAEGLVATAQSELAGVQAELAAANTEKARLQTDAKTQENFEEKYKEADSLRAREKATVERLSGEKSELSNKLTLANSKIKELTRSSEADKKSAEKEKDRLDKRILSLEKEKAAMEKKASELDSKLTNANTTSEGVVEQLRARLEQLKEQNETGKTAAKEQIDDLKSKLKDAEKDAENATGEAKREYGRLEGEIKKLEGELRKAENLRDITATQITKSQEELKTLAERAKVLDAAQQKHEAAYQKLADEKKAAVEKWIVADQALADAKRNLADADSKHVAEVAAAKRQGADALAALNQEAKREKAAADEAAQALLQQAKKEADEARAEELKRRQELARVQNEYAQFQKLAKANGNNNKPPAEQKQAEDADAINPVVRMEMIARGHAFAYTKLPEDAKVNDDNYYKDNYKDFENEGMMIEPKDLRHFFDQFVKSRQLRFTTERLVRERAEAAESHLADANDELQRTKLDHANALGEVRAEQAELLKNLRAEYHQAQLNFENARQEHAKALLQLHGNLQNQGRTMDEKDLVLQRKEGEIFDLRGKLDAAAKRLQELDHELLLLKRQPSPQVTLHVQQSDPWVALKRAGDAMARTDPIRAVQVRQMCADRPWGAAIAKLLGPNYSMMYPLAEQVMLLVKTARDMYPAHAELLDKFIKAYEKFGALRLTGLAPADLSLDTRRIWRNVAQDHQNATDTIGTTDGAMRFGYDFQYTPKDWDRLVQQLDQNPGHLFKRMASTPELNRHWRYNLSSPYEILYPLMPALRNYLPELFQV